MKTDIYVLRDENGNPLPPAVQASVLAKFSRSPESAREILKSMTKEQAEEFQKKWGVTWGHSSVAELCDMPYCFEGVSIVASKQIEAYQRGAYSEKSTRYQVFNRDSFIEPPNSHPVLRQAANVLYQAYEDLTPKVMEYVKDLMPSDTPAHIVKARAFDSLRYLLPAGTGTNVAAVLNARDARYMMSDFLSSDNTEIKALGERMVAAAQGEAPVFAMGVKPNTFEPRSYGLEPRKDHTEDRPVCLVDADDPMGVLVSFWDKVLHRHNMAPGEFSRFMEGRGKRQVPSVFKTIVLTFDVIMDYGAYRDLQRHRRCEQYPELLTTKYGFEVPDDLDNKHFHRQYCDAVERNRAIVASLPGDVPSWERQYALPLGTRFRCQFQMDLRELYYIVELRTQPQGHISYRRIAYEMYQRAVEYIPTLMRWCNAVQPTRVEAHK